MKFELSPEHRQAIQEMRNLGCAVCVFNPDELSGAPADHVEDRMCSMGWDVVDMDGTVKYQEFVNEAGTESIFVAHELKDADTIRDQFEVEHGETNLTDFKVPPYQGVYDATFRWPEDREALFAKLKEMAL